MTSPTDELKPLSKKHQAFVDQYFLCHFNGTEAYMRVYKPNTRASARANAAELLANTSIAAAIETRLAEVHMSADEALELLADMARADIGQYFDITPMGFSIDLDKANKAGITKLIKKVKQKTITINGKQEDKEIHTTEIELYDALSALEKILRVHGKFTDKVELELKDELTDDERIARLTALLDAARARRDGQDSK